MLVFVACFDISDDALRRKVGRRLEHFGSRVQRSVFEIDVASVSELKDLKTELVQWLEDDDDLRFYPLCKQCRSTADGLGDHAVMDFPVAVVV